MNHNLNNYKYNTTSKDYIILRNQIRTELGKKDLSIKSDAFSYIKENSGYYDETIFDDTITK